MTNEDDHQHCENCGEQYQEPPHKIGYRLLNGTSHEGISLRMVHYDEHNKIVGWSRFPVLTPGGGSAKDVVKDIIYAMRDLDNMLAATKKPVLDESELEKEFKDYRGW